MQRTRLGQYEVVRELGRGGMGVVYEGVHLQLQKRVALKTLHAFLADEPELVQRFLREGRAAARVRHPHVVDVTDVGVADGVPYLVMELLEGESLAARLARSAPLPHTEVIDLLLPVCSALAAAHAQSVLHRDLKPENVFLARSAAHGTWHPKVVDFGIAKVRDEDMTLTGRRSLMGTPHYMSLEQARSASDVDARTDQYSLGVIAYEALAGRRPFEGRTAIEIVSSIAIDTPPPIGSLTPSVPEALVRAVERAMAREAADRYASMRELAMAWLPFASPLAQSQWASAFGVAGASDVAASSEPGPSRIVVIEDDDAMRENVVELLEAEGFEVTSFGDGTEGLASIRAARPHLVICDGSLPGLDGFGVLRALRTDARTASLPFVFLTGRVERASMREGMKLGADDYLTKPFSRAELVDAVRTRLARTGRHDSSPGASDLPLATADTHHARK